MFKIQDCCYTKSINSIHPVDSAQDFTASPISEPSCSAWNGEACEAVVVGTAGGF